MSGKSETTINDLFPPSSRFLLTGGGKEFIERIGVEAARQVVLGVMMGENVRTQTEPLSRRRIAQTSAAIVVLFLNGLLESEGFVDRLSQMALEQIADARRNDNASIWPAQWLIGLTGKSVQNVLRSNPAAMKEYIEDFEAAIEEVATKCQQDLGSVDMTLGFAGHDSGQRVALDWKAITRLTTTIGSQTLTIRGSDKSIYGKLFERLVLGSFLTILGFERINPLTSRKAEKVFWLSDSSDTRESDATIRLRPGRLARFDIGFIGPGNSEISKDKLSRYAREIEIDGATSNSVTFIVVDRLPQTGKPERAAREIGAEIVQMSMQFWPRYLALKLEERLGFKHELQHMPDNQMHDYLKAKLNAIAIQDFLINVSPEDLEVDTDLPEVEDEIEFAEEQ